MPVQKSYGESVLSARELRVSWLPMKSVTSCVVTYTLQEQVTMSVETCHFMHDKLGRMLSEQNLTMLPLQIIFAQVNLTDGACLWSHWRIICSDF